jgi:hypothetical protein
MENPGLPETQTPSDLTPQMMCDMMGADLPLPNGQTLASLCWDRIFLFRSDGFYAVIGDVPVRSDDLYLVSGEVDRQRVADLLPMAMTAAIAARFLPNDRIAQVALGNGVYPVAAGNLRYFGMGHWGIDIGQFPTPC